MNKTVIPWPVSGTVVVMPDQGIVGIDPQLPRRTARRLLMHVAPGVPLRVIEQWISRVIPDQPPRNQKVHTYDVDLLDWSDTVEVRKWLQPHRHQHELSKAV